MKKARRSHEEGEKRWGETSRIADDCMVDADACLGLKFIEELWGILSTAEMWGIQMKDKGKSAPNGRGIWKSTGNI